MFKVMAVESLPVLGSPGKLWDLLQSDAAMATGGAVGAKNGSYLTMESGDGLLLAGVILVAGFGSVFVDPSVSQQQFADPSLATNGATVRTKGHCRRTRRCHQRIFLGCICLV